MLIGTKLAMQTPSGSAGSRLCFSVPLNALSTQLLMYLSWQVQPLPLADMPLIWL